jgi:hypothetical protein
VDRPLGHRGDASLTSRLDLRRRRVVRAACVVVGVAAIAALWRTASEARSALRADSDQRAATMASGYLGIVASEAVRTRRSSPERLLSAAAALDAAGFWIGEVQVWYAATPLLPVDTTGTGAAVAAVVLGPSGPPATVAVWGAIPEGVEEGFPWVGAGLAALALVAAAAAGEYVRRPRPRALAATVTLLVVALGAYGEAASLRTLLRAGTEGDLFRARRMLEGAAVRRRLTAGEVDLLSGGLPTRALRPGEASRDSLVARDTTGVTIAAVTGRGQAWELRVEGTVERLRPVWGLLLAWGMVAMIFGFVGAALPPAAGYFTDDRTPS